MTEQELTTLLFQLHDLGVTGIKVNYDGAGDLGAIEAISWTAKPCETPEDVNDETDAYTPGSNLADLNQECYSKIEEFAYKLLDDIEDWWNNEGGWGELCICVPSGKYIINNHIRITETEDYFHDGDLLEQIKEN